MPVGSLAYGAVLTFPGTVHAEEGWKPRLETATKKNPGFMLRDGAKDAPPKIEWFRGI
jgi:hypothetical protein